MKTSRRKRTQSNLIIIIIIMIFFPYRTTTTGTYISKCLTNSQENTEYKIMKTSRQNRTQSHFCFQRTMHTGYFLRQILELYSSTRSKPVYEQPTLIIFITVCIHNATIIINYMY